MRSSFRSVVLIALLSLLVASTAAAETYSQSGIYLFVGGLTAFDDFDDKAGNSLDESLGFDIRIGYRFKDYLAAEIAANFIDGFEGNVPTDGGTSKISASGGNVTLNLRAIYPLGRFEIYALAGVGGAWSSPKTVNFTGTICGDGLIGWWCKGDSKFVRNSGAFIAKFGAGGDLWLSKRIALTIDALYVLPTGDLKDQRYIKVAWGARFRF